MERPEAPPGELLAAEVTLLLRGAPLCAPSCLVSSSFYLRKLAEPDRAGHFLVRVEQELAAEHARNFLAPRPGVAAFLLWMEAADFLLAVPPPETTLACLCATLGPQLRSLGLCSPTLCTRADRAPPALVSVEGLRVYDAAGKGEEKEEEDVVRRCEQEEVWSFAEFLTKVRRVEELLFFARGGGGGRRIVGLEFELLKGLVVCTVLGRLRAPEGALALLADASEVLVLFSDELGRWLVHRALRTLYCTESAGRECCSVPLATAFELQCLYAAGRLDLDSFVPVLRTAERRRIVLPGLRGRREVGRLCRDERELDRRVCDLVPWLSAASLSGPAALHLSGSMLCHALHHREEGPSEPDPDWPGPSDVDVFCDRHSLAEAEEQIGHAMSDYAAWLCGSEAPWQLRRASPNDSRRKLSVDCFHRSPRLQCDLYVNSRRQVLQYHMPQVRSCWDHRDKRLFLAPSCAVALVTGLNVDCHLFAGHKTPQEILANKWLWGFNVCLAMEDAVAMVDHLRREHPEALRRAEDRGRSRCLALRSFAKLEQIYAGG
jgi:hypothetical protein